MKQKKNSKLFKAMMLSAMAMLIMCAHRASATESEIYKCMNPKGGIVYQDFACADDLLMEKLKIETNQSADVAPGLRPMEKMMLSRRAPDNGLSQSQQANNLIIIAISNSVR